MLLVSRCFLRCLVLSLVALLLGAANPLCASPITFTFGGRVDSVDPSLAGTFSTGQSLTGMYTFDSATPPRAGSNSTFAVFDALKALSFSIGGYSAASVGAPEIQLDNNPPLPDHDRYAVLARASDGLTGPPVAGHPLASFSFRLDDSTNNVFSDALILPTSLNLADFNNHRFFVFFDDQLVSGEITSLGTVASTPEPSTFTLLFCGAIAVGGAAWIRRQKPVSA